MHTCFSICAQTTLRYDAVEAMLIRAVIVVPVLILAGSFIARNDAHLVVLETGFTFSPILILDQSSIVPKRRWKFNVTTPER